MPFSRAMQDTKTYCAVMSESRALWKKHLRHVFMAAPYRHPVLVSGKDAWVHDTSGKRYLDLSSGQFSCPFGHGDRRLAKIVAGQLQSLGHTNDLLVHETVFRATSDLASIAPKGLGKAILLSTGTEANECAFRIAKAYTGKNGIVGFDRGYYGLSVATQSISAGGRYADPKVPNMFCIPVADPLSVPAGMTLAEHESDCVARARRRLARAKGRIGLFIFEPILSAGGMIFPSPGYVAKLLPLIREHRALLAFDEAQTGLGRIGRWFGCGRYRCAPDMLTVSKGLGCGLPVSAVLLNTRISKKIEGQYLHFSSHQNDPVGAAVVSYAIGRIRKEKLLARVRSTGAYFLRALRALERSDAWLANVRGEGLMLAFELEQDVFASQKSYNLGFMLQDLLEQSGVLVQAVARGRIFRLLPPYIIAKKDIDFFVDALADCLRCLKEDAGLRKKLAARNRASIRAPFFSMFH